MVMRVRGVEGQWDAEQGHAVLCHPSYGLHLQLLSP